MCGDSDCRHYDLRLWRHLIEQQKSKRRGGEILDKREGHASLEETRNEMHVPTYPVRTVRCHDDCQPR